MPVFHSTYPCLANLGAMHAVIMVQFQKGSNTMEKKKGKQKKWKEFWGVYYLVLSQILFSFPDEASVAG